MSKNFIFKLLGALVVLAASILWILSLTVPETFGFFSLAWAGVVICGGLGTILLIQGCLQKNISTMKKLKIWFAVALFICTILCLVSALVIPKSLVLPIIAIVVSAGLVLAVVFTGGMKWDEGDNHKVGYKNYHQRKAEEEKLEQENNEENK